MPINTASSPSFLSKRTVAELILEDGTVFCGEARAAGGAVFGEVVFNTAMTGYQEVLSDPSYNGQIIAFTFPEIGVVGVNFEDMEAQRIYAAGVIVRQLNTAPSNYRATKSLEAWLTEQGVPCISGVDMRKLTHHLRSHGSTKGYLHQPKDSKLTPADVSQRLQHLPPLNKRPFLVPQKLEKWTTQAKLRDLPFTNPAAVNTDLSQKPYRVVVIDFGVKQSIVDMLQLRGCQVQIVSPNATYNDIAQLQPEGVLLSNGPGCAHVFSHSNSPQLLTIIERFIEEQAPILGICFGLQLLALAGGAQLQKMKFGHHGANHPVYELDSGKVMITSQNHGFMVDETSLPATIEITHRSLFDDSIQGIRFIDRPCRGFQGHPEAGPGPHDGYSLFDGFIADIAQARQVCQNAPISKVS